MTQQNLGNVQPGKMYRDTCVAESPKPMAKPFESLADYGSATLYILMEVARSVGTALRAVIATKNRRVLRSGLDLAVLA